MSTTTPNVTWVTDDLDPGLTYTTDGRWDVIEDDEGFLLRENAGDEDAACWDPRGVFTTLAAAMTAAGS